MKQSLGEKRTILIVDDDENIRNLLAHLLKREGYAIIHAGNGWEALEHMKGQPALPAMILLDLNMPVMDGWKFRKVQKADPRLSAIPVVVITSAKTAEKDITSIEATAFFKKPIQSDILITTINEHLREKRNAT